MTELSIDAAARSAPPHGVSSREAFWVWVRVAALSFGGPAGQIAVMHRILVEEKRWIGETRFLHALNYCMLLPGPEAHQLASISVGCFIGPRRSCRGHLFVLPGVCSSRSLSLDLCRVRQCRNSTGARRRTEGRGSGGGFEAVIRVGPACAQRSGYGRPRRACLYWYFLLCRAIPDHHCRGYGNRVRRNSAGLEWFRASGGHGPAAGGFEGPAGDEALLGISQSTFGHRSPISRSRSR